ncbi:MULTISPECIES: hypothetical protein [Streptomycetaceae]|nr:MULTISPECIES: hypothetical protein [Streptomycetaceae]MBP0448384.1 hypothetical protein [Kitasatospora sp. RG8]
MVWNRIQIFFAVTVRSLLSVLVSAVDLLIACVRGMRRMARPAVRR